MSVAIACAAFGCSDRTASAPQLDEVPDSELTGMVVSNSRIGSTQGITLTGRGSVGVAAPIAYVSMAPGSLENGIFMSITNRTARGETVTVPMQDGGFDPVGVIAAAGDILDLIATKSKGEKVSFVVKTPARRPPAVVRVNPGKGRIDVALSTMITIVFTEPIIPATINSSSIRVMTDGELVSGALKVSEDQISVEFVPDRPLNALTSYSLMVTQGVLDKDGDALASVGGFESSFTTGAAPVPDRGSLVTGTVSLHTALGLRPAPFAGVNGIIVVKDPDRWTSYPRGAIADAYGVYEFRDFEKPYFGNFTTSVWVDISAGVPGYDQPCGARVELENLRARIDVELFPSDEPRPDSISKIHPSMSGIVYEQTLAGRVPLPGVLVYAGNALDMGAVASTTTDKDGRYAFCRVTDLLELFAFKTGFENGYLWWTDPRPEGVVDIELKRLH